MRLQMLLSFLIKIWKLSFKTTNLDYFSMTSNIQDTTEDTCSFNFNLKYNETLTNNTEHTLGFVGTNFSLGCWMIWHIWWYPCMIWIVTIKFNVVKISLDILDKNILLIVNNNFNSFITKHTTLKKVCIMRVKYRF